MSPTAQRTIKWAIKLFGCDTARVIQTFENRFLVIGWHRNTATERKSGRKPGQWYRNQKPIDFDYNEEHVIAKGRTWTALRASAKQYHKLLKHEQVLAKRRR